MTESTLINVERIQQPQELTGLRDEWEALVARVSGAHWALDYSMVVSNLAIRRRNRNCSLYAVRQAGELVGGLVGYSDTYRLAFVRLPIYRSGTEYVGDYLLADHAEKKAASRLIERLISDQRHIAFFEFGGIRHLPGMQLLAAINELGLKASVTTDVPAYFFDVSVQFDEFLGRLGPRLRRNLRREHRRLEANHRVEFQCITPTDTGENERLLQQFVDLELGGWKGKSGGAIGCDPLMYEYYRTITALEAAKGSMRWFVLEIDGRPAAMYMCVYSLGRMWAPKTTYDEALSKYSPGNELLVRLAERLCGEAGVHQLHMLTGADWLRHWHPEEEVRLRLRVFSPSVIGRICFEAERLIHAHK